MERPACSLLTRKTLYTKNNVVIDNVDSDEYEESTVRQDKEKLAPVGFTPDQIKS